MFGWSRSLSPASTPVFWPLFQQPRKLVDADKDGLLRVDPSVLDMLLALKEHPLVKRHNHDQQQNLFVVAIAGPYRTGKSFLLGQIMQTWSSASSSSSAEKEREEGEEKKRDTSPCFKVGETLKGQTMGIWVMASVVEGDKVVLFMDSEGTHNSMARQEMDRATLDARIFALVVLLSNVLMYNTHARLEEASLQQLSFMASLTEHMQQEDSLKHTFPHLVWILRDFQDWASLHQLFPDGDANKLYLETVLSTSCSSSATSVREAIQKMFPATRRTCHPMHLPIYPIERLQQHREKKDSNSLELEESFQRDISELVSFLRERLSQEQSVPIDDYVKLIRLSVKAMNSKLQEVNGFVPDVLARLCLEESLRMFDERMDLFSDRFPVSSSVLEQEIEKSKKMALQHFVDAAYGPSKPALQQKMEKLLAKKAERIRDKNNKRTTSSTNLGSFIILLLLVTLGGSFLLLRDPFAALLFCLLLTLLVFVVVRKLQSLGNALLQQHRWLSWSHAKRE